MCCYHKPFTHIYAETDALEYPLAETIRRQFPGAIWIPVEKYTDVFNRPKQRYDLQYSSMNLILARKRDTFLYEGAPVCHDFGNKRFFYTAMALNCLYNCDYCWLKGMYNSANLVLFVNVEDALSETEKALAEGPMYLSLAFESDLLPLESWTHQVDTWNEFSLRHDTLQCEVRTKCGLQHIYSSLTPNKNMIFAFTLSPQSLIDSLEHGTASLEDRILASNAALDHGFSVRLCFDPMIRFPGWKEAYRSLVELVASSIDLSRIKDISIGTYRQSSDYQRRMRKRFPSSAVVQYPYETVSGYCQYPEDKKTEMEQYMKQLLLSHVDQENVYLLEDHA